MKNIIGVHQLTMGNALEIRDFFKAGYYSTPPMRAITGITFPDGTICKYGEWILQYEDNSYSVITNDILQSSLATYPNHATATPPLPEGELNKMAEEAFKPFKGVSDLNNNKNNQTMFTQGFILGYRAKTDLINQ